MVGALGIMTTTIPMIVATGAIIAVADVVFKDRNGKPVGTVHFHKNRKTKRIFSHQHTQGNKVHRHTNMMGYGRTKKSFKTKG